MVKCCRHEDRGAEEWGVGRGNALSPEKIFEFGSHNDDFWSILGATF